MKEHNLSKQPQWVQSLVNKLCLEIDNLKKENEALKQVNSVVAERNWFIVQGPPANNNPNWPDVYHLWFLFPDEPHRCCSLKHGDILLVGRKTIKENIGIFTTKHLNYPNCSIPLEAKSIKLPELHELGYRGVAQNCVPEYQCKKCGYIYKDEK